MALIGTIRKNSWLLIIFIGLGLALFIITSMFVGNQIPFLDSQSKAGSINGEDVDWTQIQKAEDALKGNGDVYSQRNSIWNFFIEDALIQEQADELGLSVGEEELEELQFGPNISSVIAGRFMNPQTRQVDFAQLGQIKTLIDSDQLNPDYLKFWEYQKKEIVKAKLQSRMSALVSKSVFTPKWLIEQDFVDKNQNASFQYVKIPFDAIDNSEVTVEDSDLKSYLADNKARYYQDQQTRKVDYIVFDVFPTADDTLAITTELGITASSFASPPNGDTIFVEINEGLMDPRYFARDPQDPNPALTEVLVDPIFNAEVGEVVGPFIDGNQIKIAKLLDRRVLPDSAKCRHILIGPQVAPGQVLTENQYLAAEKTVDSLKNLLETGQAEFDSLVIKFTTDRASVADNGVYDWAPVNSYVPQFEKTIFQTGEIGELYSVRTSYGVHLIEPLGRKFADNNNKVERVQIAVIAKPIVPGDATQENVKLSAQEFMANNRSHESFVKAANEQGLNIETSTPLKSADFTLGTLGTGANSREIIRWAFQEASVGEVAGEVFEYQDPVEYYSNKFVVVALKSITEAGNPSVNSVREEIMPMVMNLKKAEKIKSQISGENLSSIASSFSSKIDTVATATFNSSFIPNLGSEPEVIATAFNLQPNAVSGPIVGNAGVYIVKLDNKSTASVPPNVPTLRRQVSQATQSQISSSLIQSMKKNAEIKDLRSKFY